MPRVRFGKLMPKPEDEEGKGKKKKAAKKAAKKDGPPPKPINILSIIWLQLAKIKSKICSLLISEVTKEIQVLLLAS